MPPSVRGGGGGATYEEVGPGEAERFPFQIRYIIGNEFCERFSYYGLRAVLALYLREFWHARTFDEKQKRDDNVTALLHSWIVLCYFFPLVGGYISDAHWGKFKTILVLSGVYCVGNICNAVTAIPGAGGPGGSNQNLAGACVSLVLIAIGTGGIKPCVAAFGGDQFAPTNPYLTIFFSLFYFSINAGSMLSTILTPLLRDNVHCFGQDECFPLAFGVPAVLMFIALLLFVAGWKYYRNVPPAGSMLSSVCGVVRCALRRRKHAPADGTGHWLRLAVRRGDDDTEGYSEAEVRDTRVLLSVLYMFLPVPIFWTLFDQTASRWTLQATEMDGCVTGSEYELVQSNQTAQGTWHKTCSSFEVLADQMQVMNAAFILILIPVFSKGVYRLFPMRPLTKMAVGMSITAAAFVLASVVQFKVDDANLGVRVGNVTAVPAQKNTQWDHKCLGDLDAANGFQSIDDCLRNPDICSDCELCVHGCTSILWQIPMYFILTCGEVMVSITGLEFAYAEAPASMKSVCQAAWLLTVAVGNIVVIIVAGSNMFGGDHGVAFEMIFYAGLMLVTAVVFHAMACGYRYNSAQHRRASVKLPPKGGEASPRGEELREGEGLLPPGKAAAPSQAAALDLPSPQGGS